VDVELSVAAVHERATVSGPGIELDTVPATVGGIVSVAEPPEELPDESLVRLPELIGSIGLSKTQQDEMIIETKTTRVERAIRQTVERDT